MPDEFPARGFPMNRNLLRKLDLDRTSAAPLINQYKRQDVFRCVHESHGHFNNSVSAYHVLKVKKCYPNGCIYFKWRCAKLDRGEACPRTYKHVGRTCTHCAHFYDLKIIKRPEVLLAPDDFARFQKELKRFENWLGGHCNRLVEFSGRINSVKPRYCLGAAARRDHVVFEGFMLNFLEGAVNAQRFKDFVYVPISARQQARYRFAKGDVIVLSGYFSLAHGSVVLKKIRSVEIDARGEPCFWTESRARVAQRTGTVLDYQPDKCYACDKGVLLHKVPAELPGTPEHRKMFCLEGVNDPEWCCYSLRKVLDLTEAERTG